MTVVDDIDIDGEGDGDGDGEDIAALSAAVDRDRDQFRAMRKQAKNAKRLEAQVHELSIELALRDAGLDLTDTQRQALLSVHTGDISADAFLATAAELSFVDQQQVSLEEQATHRRMAEATAAAPPSEAHTITLQEEIGMARDADAVTAILRREGMLAEQ